MNKKSLLLIVSLLGIAAIPQLLYFWLAPEAACEKVVYWFCTAFTVVHLGLCFYLWQTYAPRRAAAFVLVGSSILLCTLIAGALFLTLNVAARTAAYALTVMAVLYVVCTALLTAHLVAERPERESSGSMYAAYEPVYTREQDYDREPEHMRGPAYDREPEPAAAEEPRTHNRTYLPVQPQREPHAAVPLPRARVSNPPPLPEKR